MTRFRRSPDAMAAAIGEDVVALHPTRGNAFGMEGVTAAVWNALEQPRSLDEIVAMLRGEYEVEEAQARAEVAALLADMTAEGLVEEMAE